MNHSEIAQEYLQSLDLLNRQFDFNFLCDAASQHVSTFAFSSTNCWLGEELPLDFASLYNRIVVRRRGGYCFEQNGLFYQILKEVGFSVQLYLARVIFNQDTHPGLTHRITIVEYEGLFYVLDVGFGSLGPRIPVPLTGEEGNDGDRVFRVTEKRSGEYHMQIFKNGEFFSLYRFELARYGQADCELGHFYSHQHPDANFVNNLVASLILKEETRSLRNLEYWVIKQTGKKVHNIHNSTQLWQILCHELGVQVTEDESYRLYEKLNPR